jgi:ATP-dependent DNA helicase RecQ
MTSHETLHKYWQYNDFRTPQEEIIKSILDGNDTFAIMPTGGGKSICFQVPAMMQNGICLVISPLIALMKDQVAQLNQRNIKAIAITGGKSIDEISDLLDNCKFGNYKFLYLSPERLQSDWIFDRIKELTINFIAIDEAHCVSQWGHDFRPAYLKISKLKEAFPEVPFLALTASATERVKNDVIAQLHLENPSFFQKSFERKNIAYMVFETEDKLYKIEQILKKNPQPSIIYVRNRKACSDISSQLQTLGISATIYNGGLSMKDKDKNMQSWMSDKVQVMVATNAFGMGIDKPTVKTVIHINLPENIENYYQEAGRAGRNGDKAFAVLLTNKSDVLRAEKQFLAVLPDTSFLKDIFVKLCNYLRIGYGEGIEEQFQFNLNQFCLKYNFNVLKAYNSIQFLDRQGIITLSQEFSEKITIQFIIESKEVIRYMSLNPNDELVILTLVRLYPGIYESKTAINLPLISKKTSKAESEILLVLEKLKQKEIIDYQAKSNDATIIFNEVREDDLTINRISKFLVAQNKLKTEQLNSVLDYIKDDKNCKSNQILNYFGEKQSKNCGICSFCLTKKKKSKDAISLTDKIISLLTVQKMNSREIEKTIKNDSNDIILAIQNLLDKNKIQIEPNNKYSLKK